MFQYAVGRSLSLSRGEPFKMDISRFPGYKLHHGFELQRVFNCNAEIATDMEVRSTLGWQGEPTIRRILARPRMERLRRDAFVVEPHLHYWAGINNVPQDCYLMGYWPSEKYFQTQSSLIRADFTFKQKPSCRNSDLARHLAQVNAVSLHMRRGDYVNNPKTNATHGVCSLDYYQIAIQYVSDRVEQPYFFIFSDDIVWVKNNLKINFPHQVVDHNHGIESYNDMRLMSLCRHHIVANSTFSWWGAWLNPSPDKIVVAPKRWFAKEMNTMDLAPQDWRLL